MEKTPRDKEYKKVPEGNSAYVIAKSDEGSGGDFTFVIAFGKMATIQNDSKAVLNLTDLISKVNSEKEEFIVDVFPIHRGENQGLTSFSSLDHSGIVLQVPRSTTGAVKVYYVEDRHKLDDRKRLVTSKLTEVAASVFKENGFDLKQGNPSNNGVKLSPALSQLLYDFKQDQGQFRKLGRD